MALHVNSTSEIHPGLHVLLVTEDDARGKALTKVLRDHKARASDLQASLRDPAAPRGVDVILVDARSEHTLGSRLAELRNDVRARWAAVATVDYSQLVRADGTVLMASLSELINPHVEPDRKLADRAREESTFTTSLSPLGPTRLLRALSLSGHTLLVELRHPTLSASLEVANELLVSASASRAEKRWEAWSALVRILGLKDAEVSVSRRAFTSAMNIMEPVDQALEVAAQERHCSAAQIAAEESEAERLNAAPRSTMPQAPDLRTKLGMGYSPPRPAVPRPAPPNAGGTSPHKTLLGFTPGLPALGLPAAARDSAAPAAAPLAAVPMMPSKPPSEAPRHVQRTGTPNQRLNMTLLGIAPGSVPGLSELRAEAAAARAQPQPAPAMPPEAGLTLDEPPTSGGEGAFDDRELPDFDPPTGRVNVERALLDELDDELTMVAAPLSEPLPPPRENLIANDNDVPQESAAEEPEQGEAVERDERELLAETHPTPTDMRSHLIARSTDEMAKTERPPAFIAEVADEESDHEAEEPLPEFSPATTKVAEAPAAAAKAPPPPPPSATQQPLPAEPNSTDLTAPGDETWVVRRESQPVVKKTGGGKGWLLGLAGAGVLGALLFATLHKPASKQPEPRPTPAVVESPKPFGAPPAAPAHAEQAAPQQAAPAEPVAPQQTAPSQAAPAAEPTPVPAADVEQAPAVAAEPTRAPAQPAEAAPQASAAADGTADLPALLKQAQRLLMERKPAEARPLFEQALALDAANPHVHAGLAESLLKLNEPQAALPRAQAAIKLRPKRARYQVLLGDILAASGKADEAQAAWKKALELDENDAEAKQRLSK